MSVGTGLSSLTVSDTFAVVGLFVTPSVVLVIVTVAEYGPAINAAQSILAVIVAASVPLAGDSDNHAASSVAVQFVRLPPTEVKEIGTDVLPPSVQAAATPADGTTIVIDGVDEAVNFGK